MIDGRGPDPDDPLAGIRVFAADQAAVLDDLGELLGALREAFDAPDVPVDTEAIWQRVLCRLDEPTRPDGT